jgi:hypothetical protein
MPNAAASATATNRLEFPMMHPTISLMRSRVIVASGYLIPRLAELAEFLLAVYVP